LKNLPLVENASALHLRVVSGSGVERVVNMKRWADPGMVWKLRCKIPTQHHLVRRHPVSV